MAGQQPSLYLIYKDFSAAEKNSDSWYGTQVAADAAAATGGATLLAHQGAVEVPHSWIAA